MGLFAQGWTYRQAVPIQPVGALTDFTVVLTGEMIPAARRAAFWAAVQDGGGDLRVSLDEDGTTLLGLDVRPGGCAAATQTLKIAFRVPSLSAVGETTVFLWAGKAGEVQPAPGATGGQYDAYAGAWDSYYDFHDPVSSDIDDRTASGWDLVPQSGTGNIASVSGPLGPAWALDGNPDANTVGRWAMHSFGTTHRPTDMTLMFLARTTEMRPVNAAAYISGSDGIGQGSFQFDHNETNSFNPYSLSLRGHDHSNSPFFIDTDWEGDAGAHHLYAITLTGGVFRLYRDGVQWPTTVGIGGTAEVDALRLNINRGTNRAAWATYSVFAYSENEAKSPAWISASYRNLLDPASFFAADWPEPVAIGGGIDLALAATETGRDAVAVMATVSTAAAMDAAEAGRDTVAADVALAIGAALDAAEPGADRAALALSLGIGLAMAGQESGRDTLAATLAVAVTGTIVTMAAQEVGRDVASGALAVGVGAAMDAAESGADTLAADLTLAITAAMDAVEAGTDDPDAALAVAIEALLDATESGMDLFSGALFTGQIDVEGVPLRVRLRDEIELRLRRVN